MSATAALSVNYVLISRAGGFPSVISGSEAQSLITPHNDDHLEQASRFSELLDQRGAGHVPFWFAGNDVIIRGDMNTAWTINNLVQEFPNMMPRAQENNVVAFAPRAHIGPAFADAVTPSLNAPDMGASFKDVSGYEAATGYRLPRFGYRAAAAGLHAA